MNPFTEVHTRCPCKIAYASRLVGILATNINNVPKSSRPPEYLITNVVFSIAEICDLLST